MQVYADGFSINQSYWHLLFVLCIHLKTRFIISALYRSGGVGLGESGGSEADSDIPGVKTLKDPVYNNIWEICETKQTRFILCGSSCDAFVMLYKTEKYDALQQNACTSTQSIAVSGGENSRFNKCFTEAVCFFLSYLMCSRRDKDPEKIPALADVVTDN